MQFVITQLPDVLLFIYIYMNINGLMLLYNSIILKLTFAV